MTDLTKRVARRCQVPHRGRRIVVSLEPGDTLGFRLERTRTTEYVSIAAIYDFAVKARVLSERAAKRKSKK
jgi:hypothetical protein